jgi:pimeloyl-ACP methyl ester carboxylesterase
MKPAGLFSAAANDPATRRAIIDLTTGNRLPARWLDAMVDASVAHSDSGAVGDYLTAWAKTDLVDRILGKTLPVLVLAGENDPALGADTCRATWLQHYPQGRVQVLANAGHYPMEETPLALVAAIEAFLNEVMDA